MKRMINVRPKYGTVLYFKHPTYFDLRRGTGLYDALQNSVSQAQQVFIKQTGGTFAKYTKDSNDIYKFTLYGVSEEDIKVMVESMITWLDDNAFEKLKETKNKLDINYSERSNLEKSISRLNKKMEETKEVLARMKKVVRYQGCEDVRENIQEFDKLLQMITIELTGIHAKLDMIKQQKENLGKASNNYPKGTSELLLQMRLTQEIELAGALARKDAAESALKKATNFLSLVEKKKEVQRMLETKQDEFKRVERSVAYLEKELAQPSADMQPVELANTKIVIHPVAPEK